MLTAEWIDHLIVQQASFVHLSELLADLPKISVEIEGLSAVEWFEGESALTWGDANHTLYTAKDVLEN